MGWIYIPRVTILCSLGLQVSLDYTLKQGILNMLKYSQSVRINTEKNQNGTNRTGKERKLPQQKRKGPKRNEKNQKEVKYMHKTPCGQ